MSASAAWTVCPKAVAAQKAASIHRIGLRSAQDLLEPLIDVLQVGRVPAVQLDGRAALVADVGQRGMDRLSEGGGGPEGRQHPSHRFTLRSGSSRTAD